MWNIVYMKSGESYKWYISDYIEGVLGWLGYVPNYFFSVIRSDVVSWVCFQWFLWLHFFRMML